MPNVKIDYVVSFSSEDPEHPASNLLSADVKSKWLCSKGEPSCSIVLQLKSACKIDSITIGAYHVALIEVLVGLSERPNDPFQVLVPSCVLLSPPASRRGDSVECVRSFAAPQLAGAARAQRWDRVRVVCSQPYNKHCKYGLAFVHISSGDAPSSAAPAPTAVAPLRLQLDAETGSSDDEFRPGELFAKYRRNELHNTSTEAQIKQASSHALKNIADTSTKITKTPISKTGGARPSRSPEPRADRSKRSLLYTRDDDQPHHRIDRVLQRHRDQRDKAAQDARPSSSDQNTRNSSSDTLNSSKTVHSDDDSKVKHTDKNTRHSSSDTLISSKTVHSDDDTKAKHRDKNKTPQKTSQKNLNTESATASQQKRKRPTESEPELGPVCAAPGAVLAGAVVAMSGYENPRRAALRAAALELGAQYLRDWEPRCTYLICAFPNTPKLRAVRAARAGTVAVLGEWLEQCRARRRRLPWRWFATDPQQREPVPEHFDRPAGAADSEGDTDDEIEKVLRQQEKKQRRDPTPDEPSDAGRDQPDGDGRKANDSVVPGDSRSPSSRDSCKLDAEKATAMDTSRDSDVTFVRDERVRARISLHSDSDDTAEDEPPDRADSHEITKELPSLWSGSTFALSAALPPRRAALLARYIRAYGGLVLQESEVLEDSGVQYVVAEDEGNAEGAGDARRVRPEWVWRQHASRGLRSSATT